jgi:hypothetical protein
LVYSMNIPFFCHLSCSSGTTLHSHEAKPLDPSHNRASPRRTASCLCFSQVSFSRLGGWGSELGS